MLQPVPAAQEFFWDDLLEFIEERRVIPIVGAELLTLPGRDGETPLLTLLAQKLAERLHVPAEDCTGDDALHQVVCRYLQAGGRREEIYPRLRTLLKELAPPVPAALRQLACIRHFNLYVTTTFDSLLAQAIDEERFAGAPRTVSLAYAPSHHQDLPAEARQSDTPIVFHLLGRASAAPDYVITEEDTLEFFSAMQSEPKRPHVLLDELKASHLLLIGTTFPDWLARFFIRMAKNGRLSLQRDELEVIADRRMHEDRSLVLFLRNFSYRTQIFEQGNAADFVAELAARYAKRHGTLVAGVGDPGSTIATSGATAAASARPATTATDSVKPGAVFLSYASQDVVAVRRIRDALEAAGIDVWLDQRHLEGGDEWDAQIKRHIRTCAYFVPVISANTQARHEGYFRFEWDLAVERSRLIAESIPFLLPLVIDPLSETDAIVPERFLKVQWTRLPSGEPSPEFVERMVRLIREHRKRERGLM